MATIGMYNEKGENVDLYIPRKCHATNTLIAAHDYSSVQIAIANVSATGVIDGTTTTVCIAGYIRAQGESDHAINHIAIERGIVRIRTRRPKAKKSKAAKGGAAANQKNAKGAAAANQKKGAKGAPAAGNQKKGAKGAASAAPQKGRAAPQKGAAPRKNRA